MNDLIEKEKEIIRTEKTIPEIVETIHKSGKTAHEWVSDALTAQAGDKASQDPLAIAEIAQHIAQGSISEAEGVAMQKENIKSAQYFERWEQILKFAFIKKPTGLILMYIGTVWGIICYVITLLMVLPLLILGEIFSTFNSLFNAVFGEVKYKTTKDGQQVEWTGYNLLSKILFGITAVLIALLIIFGFIQAFTGWSVFRAIRSS